MVTPSITSIFWERETIITQNRTVIHKPRLHRNINTTRFCQYCVIFQCYFLFQTSVDQVISKITNKHRNQAKKTHAYTVIGLKIDPRKNIIVFVCVCWVYLFWWVILTMQLTPNIEFIPPWTLWLQNKADNACDIMYTSVSQLMGCDPKVYNRAVLIVSQLLGHCFKRVSLSASMSASCTTQMSSI